MRRLVLAHTLTGQGRAKTQAYRAARVVRYRRFELETRAEHASEHG